MNQMTIQFDDGHAEHFKCDCSIVRAQECNPALSSMEMIPMYRSFGHAGEAGWRFDKSRKGHCPTCMRTLFNRQRKPIEPYDTHCDHEWKGIYGGLSWQCQKCGKGATAREMATWEPYKNQSLAISGDPGCSGPTSDV